MGKVEWKVKLPDLPIKVKPRSESAWSDEDKMLYVLSRTGKTVHALIQTGYLEDEYSTMQEMLQTLANNYNDPHKRVLCIVTSKRT